MLESFNQCGLNIQIITTEARPTLEGMKNNGQLVLEKCKDLNLSCKIIPDSAVAVYMSEIDCVLVGCEAVLANGGIVNKVGTYSVALIAGDFQKPVYVFC